MSLQPLRRLNYSLFEFMKQYKGSKQMSHSTRICRTNRLRAMFAELHGLGYKIKHIRGLKQKHVACLVAHWQEKGISVGSIKNRLSDLRFVCRQLGKHRLVQTNDFYQVGARQLIPTESKAIHSPNFQAVDDERVLCSYELQRVFGLRAAESIKIIPTVADQGNQLFIYRTWAKGGVERYIPIQTEEQRYWLDRAKVLAAGGSLIPPEKSYIQQNKHYYWVASKAGLSKLHGLRHAYAQRRYKELTGWESPLNGGPSRSALKGEEAILDRKARFQVSVELGHGRLWITSSYCGT